MRQFNERVVLQAIRLHGSVPKAEIARLTHLTAQTVQIIIARLEADELVRKLVPVRGKVGQPSVPMALNPDGAFSIGVKIGRRSMDMLLRRLHRPGARAPVAGLRRSPTPTRCSTRSSTRLRQLRKRSGRRCANALHGIGVAAPLSLGGWHELLGIAPELRREVARHRHARAHGGPGDDAGCRSSSSRTPPPLAWPSWWPAAAAASAASCTCSSTPSSAAAWCSTATCCGGVTGNAGAVGSLPLGLSTARGDGRPSNCSASPRCANLEALYAAPALDVNA